MLDSSLNIDFVANQISFVYLNALAFGIAAPYYTFKTRIILVFMSFLISIDQRKIVHFRNQRVGSRASRNLDRQPSVYKILINVFVCVLTRRTMHICTYIKIKTMSRDKSVENNVGNQRMVDGSQAIADMPRSMSRLENTLCILASSA